MTEPLPAALRIPEVSRFINRANQLRAVKPAISYWCEYHAVNQIVGKSLHTTDDDCFAFTKTLIERLEATKTERADDDAIVDNDAGQAYVEQFAHETFARAERTLRANKVTRQTADTFDAAATFFDLTREWGPPDPETLQKIKFAKWNAARILKAIRDGKDPNESNPKPPPPTTGQDANDDGQPVLSLDDPDVRQIMSPPPLPASVEDAPDAGDHTLPQSQPLPPPPVQEGYFPPDPSAPPDSTSSFDPSSHSRTSEPSAPPLMPPPASTTHFPSQPSPQFSSSVQPSLSQPAMGGPGSNTSTPPVWSPVAAPAVSSPALSHGLPIPSAANQRDINQAQKHAKWAISALNFEDVPTAIKELRSALATLGAQ
ncbi:hypothetical protein HIM_05160 [Hirsutella minnesotensis 3608]|uniref:Vta1 C-terminal domain-containing protein n=1 Tax=Hirsutella minnesotensis 3608 TaxID=1043627 RepID=A0A0F8A5K0_9HYPO|nr:hypothetical protein HIM_05160 [Hirsutella minnesotensis 3608]